jgi:hypothetical protein
MRAPCASGWATARNSSGNCCLFFCLGYLPARSKSLESTSTTTFSRFWDWKVGVVATLSAVPMLLCRLVSVYGFELVQIFLKGARWIDSSIRAEHSCFYGIAWRMEHVIHKVPNAYDPSLRRGIAQAPGAPSATRYGIERKVHNQAVTPKVAALSLRLTLARLEPRASIPFINCYIQYGS